ncbi:RNA polymerase sigma factor [SAR92 clade bacterium H246]
MSDLKNQQKTNSAVLTAYKTHVDALRRFISRYLRNAQDIEDVTQEAFMRAYKAEQTTDIRQPKSFLFRIAKNVAISELRSKSRQITDYIEDQSSTDVLLQEWTTEDEAMAQQKLGIHCEAVASLPPKCRRVYLMRKVYGMPHKEIAQRLGIALSTVEKHLLKGVEGCDRYIRERMDEQPAAIRQAALSTLRASKPVASRTDNSSATNLHPAAVGSSAANKGSRRGQP